MDSDWSQYCLTEESELQLQLVSSQCHHEHALHLFKEQPCRVLVEAFAIPQTLPRPQVRVKVLDRQSGSCEQRDQGERGIPLVRSGNQQILLYAVRSLDFSQVGFIFSIFADGSSQSMQIGRTSLLPKHFLSHDRTSCLAIFSPDLQPIGTLSLTHLLIKPTKGLPKDLFTSAQELINGWSKGDRAVDIGHRGLGDSYCEDEERNPPITENTIESLRRAGEEYGADYVEFDVQLTRDMIPVVYHDFRACASLVRDAGAVESCRSKVFVKDLSLEEIRNLKLEHVSVMKSEESSKVEVDFGGKLEPRDDVEVSEDVKPFPTLEKLFQISACVGFNIEVKYPVPELANTKYNFPYFDRNEIADRILEVVFEHAQKRKIIFSCFDADMCTILRLKQPRYPVLFLTNNGCPQWKDQRPIDMRSREIRDCLMHAKAQSLQGINIDSYQLLHEPEVDWVGLVKEEMGLALYTWGRENNSLTNIEQQRRMGVDGIVYDRIDKVSTSLGPPPEKRVCVKEDVLGPPPEKRVCVKEDVQSQARET